MKVQDKDPVSAGGWFGCALWFAVRLKDRILLWREHCVFIPEGCRFPPKYLGIWSHLSLPLSLQPMSSLVAWCSTSAFKENQCQLQLVIDYWWLVYFPPQSFCNAHFFRRSASSSACNRSFVCPHIYSFTFPWLWVIRRHWNVYRWHTEPGSFTQLLFATLLNCVEWSVSVVLCVLV